MSISALSVSIYPNRSAMPEALQRGLNTPAFCTLDWDLIPDEDPRAVHLEAKGEDIYHPQCLQDAIRHHEPFRDRCLYCKRAIDTLALLSREKQIDQIEERLEAIQEEMNVHQETVGSKLVSPMLVLVAVGSMIWLEASRMPPLDPTISHSYTYLYAPIITVACGLLAASAYHWRELEPLCTAIAGCWKGYIRRGQLERQQEALLRAEEP